MKDNRDCKIVRDLLPNYIEDLTDKETNQYIEEHLENCEDCKKTYDNMKLELDNPKDEITHKKVDGFKKYNSKLKKFRAIVNCVTFIIVAVIVIFVICFIRRLIIFNDLQSKLDLYKNSNNYYLKITQYSEGYLDIIMEFRKDGKYMMNHQFFDLQYEPYAGQYRVYGDDNLETEDWFKYNEINKEYEYYVTQDKIENMKGRMYSPSILDCWLEDKENILQYLKMALFATVKTEKCNEKDCYKITKTHFMEDSLMSLKPCSKEYIYIEQDTGLIIRREIDVSRNIMDCDYSFGSVTDKTIEEPEIEDYNYFDGTTINEEEAL